LGRLPLLSAVIKETLSLAAAAAAAAVLQAVPLAATLKLPTWAVCRCCQQSSRKRSGCAHLCPLVAQDMW
jgi:hypothetical protein